MQNTSEAAKQKAEKIADRLAEEEGVENAVIDDFGRYGNFQIALSLPAGKAFHGNYHIDTNFRSLTPRIKSALGEFDDAWIDYRDGAIEHPEMQYRYTPPAGHQKLGYDRTYSLVHVRINL